MNFNEFNTFIVYSLVWLPVSITCSVKLCLFSSDWEEPNAKSWSVCSRQCHEKQPWINTGRDWTHGKITKCTENICALLTKQKDKIAGYCFSIICRLRRGRGRQKYEKKKKKRKDHRCYNVCNFSRFEKITWEKFRLEQEQTRRLLKLSKEFFISFINIR